MPFGGVGVVFTITFYKSISNEIVKISKFP
jgi:hypothetical protein